MKSINSEELHNIFEKIANKNEIEFNKLYKEYSKLVYSIAFSILKNKHDSEDIVQRVFFKIWKMEKSKLPTQNESSWLYTVTKNEAFNLLKKKKEEINIEDLYYISDDDKEINEVIEQQKYNSIIAKLSIKEQEIVSLKILSNLSFEQISKILNMPIGTVKWKYYKALNLLKLSLESFGMLIIIFVFGIKTLFSNKKGNIGPQKTESIKEVEKLDSVENEKNIDNLLSNEEQQEIFEQEQIQPLSAKPYEIGVLSISSIIFIIIFLFFLIKSQLKTNCKMSK